MAQEVAYFVPYNLREAWSQPGIREVLYDWSGVRKGHSPDAVSGIPDDIAKTVPRKIREMISAGQWSSVPAKARAPAPAVPATPAPSKAGNSNF